MRIIKDTTNKLGFSYIAFVPDELCDKPSVIFQLHGRAGRGDGSNLDVILVNGFPNIIADELLKDKVLIMPQCPFDSFWTAKIESLKMFFDNCI